MLDDDRVIALLEPARRLSSEVIKLRDDGRITGTVCTETERHYSTAGLLAAEFVTRSRPARTRGVSIVPAHVLDRVLAAHAELDPDQRSMVVQLCSFGHGWTW